jgi:hypothetical protein
MIDGKSKEIKFPFNLFTDSTHEVACELAVDVGILEPDLEDIADSIRFLVTEGKINNLRDEQVDVWEEAPEPRSFSSKLLPHVSKMSVVQMTSAGLPQQPPPPPPQPQPQQPTPQAQPQTPHPTTPLEHNVVPGTPLDRSQTVPVFSLSDHNMLTSPQTVLTVPSTTVGDLSSRPEGPSVMMLDPSGAGVSVAVSPSVNSTVVGFAPMTESGPRSPSHASLSHASSESTLATETLLSKLELLELRERGVSIGSLKDPLYIQKVHSFEDRMKVARSAFDERESTLEAAIRSEEEKHQREIERFRKKMEELNKQRAAITRQQNGSVNGSANDESLEGIDGQLLQAPVPPSPLLIVTDANHLTPALSPGSDTPQPLVVSSPADGYVMSNGAVAYESRPPETKSVSANANDGDVPVSPNDASR